MSKIEVNTVDVSSGSTLTLGSSGKTITIPAGATISNAGTSSGFGGSGAVSWDTTVKTSTFTGATGIGYFVNTSGGAVTLNLPAGSAGNIIAVSDYSRNFATANLTINPNGSEKIGGVAEDLILDVNGQALTLIYVDGTNGWINVQNAEDTETGTSFVSATGGTITTVGNCKIHTFTSPGTFAVSGVSGTTTNNVASVLIVAGGSGGGYDRGGGGGAGGYREFKSPVTPFTASPLAGSGLTLSAQSYPIVVGAGSTAGTGPSRPPNGSNSSAISQTSAGGGGAGSPGATSGNPGGSGGGARDVAASGGTGNVPPVSPPQGNAGGSSTGNQSGPGGGGGGATQTGFDGQGNPSQPTMGDGGDGATTSINNSATAYAGGGGSGGGGSVPAGGEGGTGGGGTGAGNSGPDGTAGTANTGGGGGAGNGGGSGYQNGKAGGSGIVIIRYKFQ